jgi:hypothetical protein
MMNSAAKLLDAVSALKEAAGAGDAARSHNSPARCRGCGLRLNLNCRDSPASEYAGCDAGVQVTCPKCKVPMKEVKGHIYHRQRKWKCPNCDKVRMQKHKETSGV